MNSSPSIWGNRLCVTTYAGSIFCLDRNTGRKLWSTYVKRDAFRYESFYASASTDGKRLYTIARSGKVVALDAATGDVLWTQQQGGYGYSTRVPLSEIPPGLYVLNLEARSRLGKDTAAMRQVQFRVVSPVRGQQQ